jgi:hypothetical protein
MEDEGIKRDRSSIIRYRIDMHGQGKGFFRNYESIVIVLTFRSDDLVHTCKVRLEQDWRDWSSPPISLPYRYGY